MVSRRDVRSTLALIALASLALAVPTAARADDIGSTTDCLFTARYDITWRPGASAVTVTLGTPSSQIVAKDAAMRAQGWRVDQIHTYVETCANDTTVSYDVQWRQTSAPEIILTGCRTAP
jgi:hypothetical protein